MFFGGLFLSAFFSGSEIGFYRAPRVRMVIDAVGGDRTARGLLWASNNPEAFVATALVGNNIVNYAIGFATVLLAAEWLPDGVFFREVVPAMVSTPVVFIYGELLPKRSFLQAPYKLLRLGAPLLALLGVLLAPASAVLWGGSKLVARLTGAKLTPLRMSLRRRELADVFAEGQAVGILTSVQRELAMATFALAGKPVREFMTPVAREPRLPAGVTADGVLRVARRWRIDALPVETRSGGRVTYRLVRASRCVLADAGDALPDEPMPEFPENAAFLQVITQIESGGQPMAALRSAGDRVVGFVRLDRLQRAMWEGE
jgi:CBS domain containing-hemolysin-like protein